MAAKLLHSLTDDNPELQKQIGCMTGILQLFDRQPMLTGGRRIVGHSARRVPLGRPHVNGGGSEREPNGGRVTPTSMEKYSHNRQRVSTESSMVSFSSSSPSSSLSSPECNRPLEQVSFDRAIYTEPPSVEPATMLQHPSPQYSRQSVDIRDLVKDSMYREIQGLSSIKAKMIEEEAAVPVTNLKYRDSPRLQPKISEDYHGSDHDHWKKTPADLKESLRALAKLQDASKYRNEPRELSRSLSYHSRDAPRFSYDGRETARIDSGDGSKSSLKLRDLPRLSLDSRERSMQMNADTKSNLLSKNIQKDISVLNGKFQSQPQASGNQARPPSVVAKLMGLEALPDSVSSSNANTVSSQSYPGEGFVNNARPMEKAEQLKPIQVTNSSNNLWKEPKSPRWRNPDSSVKPLSKFPIEPAPWKQIDGSKASQKPVSRIARGSVKPPPTIPSVYSVIETRLKDLEFTQSGKDLRALKQILEAMQAKGFIETSREDDEQMPLNSARSVDKRPLQTGPIKKKVISAQSHESPIVIMKPMKLVEKSGSPASVVPLDSVPPSPSKFQSYESVDSRKGISNGRTAKDATSKPGQRVNDSNSAKSSKTTQSSTRPHPLVVKEGNVGSVSKISGSISPRMQQKKRPPTSPDSSKPARQSNKQQGEANSPGGRRRSKPQIYQKNDDQLSDASVESRNGSPSRKTPELRRSDSLEKKSTLILSEGESAESGYVPPEYSSPVSVLENVLRKEDSASPIKYVGKILKVDASVSDERSISIQHIPAESFVSSTESGAAFEINRKKLQNINNLVQKLRRLNSTHDEARTDYIASLCDNANADHRYVSEILLASGLLLRDLADFQFHPSGHPLNPELFLVLEQTKTSSSSKQEASTRKKIDKNHRKLVFDAVNEILARKLVPSGPQSEPWILPSKLAKKSLNAQKLLKELCSEIDALQSMTQKCSSDEEADDDAWKNILSKDVHQAESWNDLKGDTSGAVLDIERLIFKDLVNEIVNGECVGLMSKPGGQRHNAK